MKYLAIILTILFAAPLAACNNDQNGKPDQSTNNRNGN